MHVELSCMQSGKEVVREFPDSLPHKDLAKVIRDIELLEPGDEVFIENFRETLVYETVETKVIDPDEIQEVLIQDGKDMVTLITCHPYRENRQRYVVYCERKKN